MREGGEEAREQPDDAGGVPRWVKAFALVALVAVMLVVVLLVVGGHGPGRHLPSGAAYAQAWS